MAKARDKKLWLFWVAIMIAMASYFASLMTQGKDKTLFMPGELTAGHYQIELSCDSCHKGSFTDRESMIETCVECHGDQRVKPFDSHPKAKFTDPRNADRLENINALECISCHVEHQPHNVKANGVTQPNDFCIYCHKDIGKDRPSHQGMAFDTCASAGCHNFHNNRALYTDFLIKHMDEPDISTKTVVPQKEFIKVLDEIITYPHDKYPVKKLSTSDMDVPANINTTTAIKKDWLTTAHAKSGVNCSACHMQVSEDTSTSSWINNPDHQSCNSCHDMEVKNFMRGKHGMRLSVGLDAMTPADARLPMKSDALAKKLECNSCHPAHRFDIAAAAVDSCLACHDDEHSRSYKQSSHYRLWQKELKGELPAGSGVSCATCHMPRIEADVSDWLQRIMVQHNQNATLNPNEKMIRPACMHCHGLGFSIDALADKNLILNNFNGRPSVHIESIDMAKAYKERHEKEKSAVQ